MPQIGITGNLMVVTVVLTRKHMRTTTNMYIVNLAAADILMCLGKISDRVTTMESARMDLTSHYSSSECWHSSSSTTSNLSLEWASSTNKKFWNVLQRRQKILKRDGSLIPPTAKDVITMLIIYWLNNHIYSFKLLIFSFCSINSSFNLHG